MDVENLDYMKEKNEMMKRVEENFKIKEKRVA